MPKEAGGKNPQYLGLVSFVRSVYHMLSEKGEWQSNEYRKMIYGGKETIQTP